MKKCRFVSVIVSVFLQTVALGSAVHAQEGVDFTFSLPQEPDNRGQPRPPAKADCWLPKDCSCVRGVVVAHPMIRQLAVDPRFRRVAAEEGLGTMLTAGAFATSGKETMERLDKIFDQWAAASKHPEIRGAAVFTGGLSASVLWARNVGYGAPDRVFGILHVAGGNLHHAMNDQRKTLSGVPFMAANGQFESCGPDGGIRPHLGLETQWYLMGDTMLERRKDDPDNLMCLVVIPSKGHTAWNMELAAWFLRKAAQYRLPKEKRDGSTPAKCVQIKAEDGWLTDRDVKYPKHEPAAYADYKGDKTRAFWHFDKEMALAVCRYHKDGIRPGQEHTLFRPVGLFEELWPLGEKMDIAFQGDTAAEYAATLREWLAKKTGNRLSAEVVRCLAETVAGRLQKDKEGKAVDESVCRKAIQCACYAYDDLYRPVEESIAKTGLSAESRDFLRSHYAQQLVALRPGDQQMPELPVRGIQAWIAGIPAGFSPAAIKARLQDGAASHRTALAKLYGTIATSKPADLDRLLADLKTKDAKAGWAAVDELVKLGAAATAELVRTMDYAGQPANFRAAAALGRMGKAAAPALPDLRRNAQRSQFSEMDSTLSTKSLEAIAEIEKQ